MISICRYTQDKHSEWDDFVKVSKNGTFLFLRAYMDYHSDRFHDHSLMFHNEKGKLIAVLPANIRTASPPALPRREGADSITSFSSNSLSLSLLSAPAPSLRGKSDVDNIGVCVRAGGEAITLHSHQGLTYGGFVLSPEIHISEVGELFRLTISYLKENGFCEWRYKQIPYIYHLLPSQEEDYWLWRHNAREDACNMMTVIDFKSTVNDISSSRKRTYFNKLQRQGYTVVFDADINDFWPILEANLMERFGSHPVHCLSEITLLKQRFFTIRHAAGSTHTVYLRITRRQALQCPRLSHANPHPTL